MTDETPAEDRPLIIVGAGFTGLSAAYELASVGRRVIVLDEDDAVGGLARGFEVGGATLERFYHHWFTNDRHIMALIKDIGELERVIYRPTRTGMYYANTIFRLSSPLDLLRFKPLNIVDRVRLGLLALRARAVRNWRALEGITARDWLVKMAGRRVYEVVWEPLLAGKFGIHAERVGAVWFWKKLALRGGSRAADGREVLAYYKGGFPELARRLQERLEAMGVEFRLKTSALSLQVEDGRAVALETDAGVIPVCAVLLTAPLPRIADILHGHVDDTFEGGLRRVSYLANICLVLELDRSLSSTYWLNVNDPSFPFVGVIEHTNLEPTSSYGGRHIVYLSKYLPETDALYRMSDAAVFDYALPHLQKMFPDFEASWVLAHHVWRARFSQPIAEPGYSAIIPPSQTPIPNVTIATMAQIYPEDRGTNYAVREGRRIGREMAAAS